MFADAAVTLFMGQKERRRMKMKMLGKLLTFLLTLFLPFLEGTNIV
jgi:hypothetical protein